MNVANFDSYCPRLLRSNLNRVRLVNNRECGVICDPEPADTLCNTEMLFDSLDCTCLMCDFQLILSSIITPRNLFS